MAAIEDLRPGQPVLIRGRVDRLLSGADQGLDGAVVGIANPVAGARADAEHRITVSPADVELVDLDPIPDPGPLLEALAALTAELTSRFPEVAAECEPETEGSSIRLVRKVLAIHGAL